jgi:MFS family permease
MNLQPKEALTEQEVQTGLKLVIGDGLTAEVMITVTGGAFLISMAILLGASNFQIGVLAALPTFTNLFQLVSIWLVRRFNNRRAVTVMASLCARLPLIVIGILPYVFKTSGTINLLIFFLFFHYLFGSIAGPSWNAWMKDLVPEQSLGAYFSKRNSYTQILNVILSLILAFVIDYVKSHDPGHELDAYGIMFIVGGVAGISGAFILSRVQEPQSIITKANIFKLFSKPLKDGNFQRLMFFNSVWAFALGIAAPFFTVFMLKSAGLSLPYVIGLSVLSQVAGIFTVRLWGGYADRYSNKTILAISAPLYILCLVAWCFVGLSHYAYVNLSLLAAIHVVTGISNAGVNLSITNLGLKLSPKNDAIVYLSVRNMVLSVFGSLAPLLGGKLADYFMHRSLTVNLEWTSPSLEKVFYLVSLHEWNFIFIISAFVALVAMELLMHVKEVGEVEKELVVKIIRHSLRTNLRDFFVIGTLMSWHEHLWEIIRRKLAWK